MTNEKFDEMESAIISVYPVLTVLADLLTNPDVDIVDPSPAGIAWILQQAADTLKKSTENRR